MASTGQTPPSATVPTPAPTFQAPATKFGARGNDVLDVQRRLNETRCKVSTVGAGSPGNETNYFGNRTRAALTCIQKLHNIPVTGEIDAQTKVVLGIEDVPAPAALSIEAIIIVLSLVLSDPTHPLYGIFAEILGLSDSTQ